ncbi:unnamed protein product [Amoebophrya sp. A120]|nr:unnamed protein product [Amoebophrya sp. A120]|eukprot:GSA120T00020564001.1
MQKLYLLAARLPFILVFLDLKAISLIRRCLLHARKSGNAEGRQIKPTLCMGRVDFGSFVRCCFRIVSGTSMLGTQTATNFSFEC